jgi:hypothetical protein
MQLGARQLLLALFIITIFQVSKCSQWPNVTHSHLTRESLQDIFSGSCSGSWGITNTRWGITKIRWGITNTKWGNTNTRWGITNTRLGTAAPGLGALDEPYRLAKPAQRSCFTCPPGFLRVFSKLTLVLVWRHKCIFKN